MKLKLSYLSCSAALAGLILACNATASFGGHGWVQPPPTWTLSRTSNTYNYYWNTPLLGVHGTAGGPYPMVYQPTDTTQLGFYYQTVPRWQYRPEMLPPAPVPYWPIGRNMSYGGGWTGPAAPPAPVMNNGVPPNVTPIVPAPQPNGVVPPPPAESTAPQVNVPEPEAAVFPNRARR